MIFLLILFLSFSFCLCSFTNLQSIDASHHASKISICTLDLCEFIDLYIYNEQRDISDRYMRKIIKLKMEKQQVGEEDDEDSQDEEDGQDEED